MNSKDIETLVDQRQGEISDIASRAGDTVYGTVAPIWKDMFASRNNFPTAEQFKSFRSPKAEFVVGVGGQRDQGEMAELFTQAVTDIVDAHNVPDDVVAKIIEPELGAPPKQPYRANQFSPVFLNNIAPVWRAVQAVEKFGPARRPLRVGEIGAGFGAGAQILHQALDIESYTIIDLAENLYLSSLFLPLTLGRTHRMIDPRAPESLTCAAQLNFSLASFTDDLKAPPFDLIWNRASMGEMPAATAAAYVSWIRTHLAPDGIFFFANRFNVPNSGGARRLSDYGLQHFDIHDIRPMERMSRPANQIHSEVIASPPSPSHRAIPPAHLDVIGDLIACGFDPQIAHLRQAAVHGTLTSPEAAAMDLLNAVFQASSLQAKYDLLQKPELKVLGEIREVLLAAVELLGGASPQAAARKAAVFALDLGFKLELRLRGLYAETEARTGGAWQETLHPMRAQSGSLHRMAELLIQQGKASFSGCFRRELRVTA